MSEEKDMKKVEKILVLGLNNEHITLLDIIQRVFVELLKSRRSEPFSTKILYGDGFISPDYTRLINSFSGGIRLMIAIGGDSIFDMEDVKILNDIFARELFQRCIITEEKGIRIGWLNEGGIEPGVTYRTPGVSLGWRKSRGKRFIEWSHNWYNDALLSELNALLLDMIRFGIVADSLKEKAANLLHYNSAAWNDEMLTRPCSMIETGVCVSKWGMGDIWKAAREKYRTKERGGKFDHVDTEHPEPISISDKSVA